MTRLQLAVSVMGFVSLNVVGAVIYKVSRPRAEMQVAALQAPPSPAAALDLNAEKFRAYRSAGLVALEKGDYDRAVEQFMQALRVGRADSDIMELIKMAKEFQARGPAKVAAGEPVREAVARVEEPAPAPVPKKEPVRPARAAPRKEPVRVAEVRPRAEEPPPLLTLLVTSIPSGLIIEVDGARRDMTPAKVQVPGGTHAVSFFKGENRLLQRTVTGEGGQVLTVDADLSARLTPPPEPVAKVDPPAPPAPEVPAPAPAKLAPPPAFPPASVTPPAPVAAMAAPTGELQIISLNVHGEVFVDGQSYGYTPVVAKNLPAQQVKIEVKVDGSVRRSRTADVVAGKRSTIKIP
jgi:hypothetical protein